MTKRTVTLVLCDLAHDEEQPAETITIQLDRESVECDLCPAHYAEIVAPLVAVGRVIRKPGRKPAAKA